jgi:hypothetical protein
MESLPGSAPTAGQYTVTTSALPMGGTKASGANGRANGGVIVKAPSTNTATVFIGGSASLTTANGYPLAPGDSVALPVDDPSRVFAIVAAATQDLRFIYQT